MWTGRVQKHIRLRTRWNTVGLIEGLDRWETFPEYYQEQENSRFCLWGPLKLKDAKAEHRILCLAIHTPHLPAPRPRYDPAIEPLMPGLEPPVPNPAQRLPGVLFLWSVPVPYQLLHILNIIPRHNHQHGIEHFDSVSFSFLLLAQAFQDFHASCWLTARLAWSIPVSLIPSSKPGSIHLGLERKNDLIHAELLVTHYFQTYLCFKNRPCINLKEGLVNHSPQAKPSSVLFMYSPQQKMVFTFFNEFKKKKGKQRLCDRDHIGPVSPKIFIWPLIEKVFWPLT